MKRASRQQLRSGRAESAFGTSIMASSWAEGVTLGGLVESVSGFDEDSLLSFIPLIGTGFAIKDALTDCGIL